jgi:hypothetical protein
MLKTIAAVLALSTGTTALGDVDSEFPSGAHGIQWGSTLQQVQVAHPGGTASPTSEGEVVYALAGDFRVLGVDLSVPLIQFVFTKQNQLQRVFWHFRHSDREAALYGVAQRLGQDYAISDEARGRVFRWKPGQASFANFEIGTGPQFPWAFLAARSIGPEIGGRQ